MNLDDYANKIEQAVFKVLRERKYITKDLGGNSSTKQYTKAIIDSLVWKFVKKFVYLFETSFHVVVEVEGAVFVFEGEDTDECPEMVTEESANIH